MSTSGSGSRIDWILGRIECRSESIIALLIHVAIVVIATAGINQGARTIEKVLTAGFAGGVEECPCGCVVAVVGASPHSLFVGVPDPTFHIIGSGL